MPYYMQDLHPDCSAAVVLIQHLSVDELKDLLNNDERLDGLVKDLPQVKNAETEREMLIAANRSLAEFNLSHEPRLKETRQQLIELYQQAVELKDQVEEKKKRLDDQSQQMSLDTTLALLQTATAQLEEETENIAQNFLESQLSVELFNEMFLEKRKTMHMRRVKTDKMPEIVAKCNQQRNVPTMNESPLPSRPAPPRPSPQLGLRPAPAPPQFVNPYYKVYN